jgi:hypothetical protein
MKGVNAAPDPFAVGNSNWIRPQKRFAARAERAFRSMSWDGLRFVSAEEMSGWTLPKEAVKAGRENEQRGA